MFRVDHQGGSLADLIVESIGEGKVRITSSDGVYDLTVPQNSLKFHMQQLEDRMHEDAQFGRY